MLQKDSRFEGSFITAVKTTGIFCRPTCHARKPKRENVEFFNTPHEAITHGYRPCKICTPMEKLAETSTGIRELLRDLSQDPYLRLKDRDLLDRGLQPKKIRRWFKRNHGMTFQAFQRMLRINTSYEEIARGKRITDVAFDSGYASLSGFSDRFQSVFGTPPSAGSGKTVIHIDRITTPLGPMYVCATAQGLCLLEFTDRRMLETEFKDLQKRLNAVILPGRNQITDQTQDELEAYFHGKRRLFSVPLQTPGTAFQQSVWRLLQQIPYGQTRTYKQQAVALGNAAGVRAVASANGHNRVAIIIPCHRVIGQDGSLTGYAGGLARKKWLINHERKHAGLSVQTALDF